MTMLTPAKFATLCNVTPQAVSKWRQADKLHMVGELVDVERTHAKMLKHRKGGSPLTGVRVNGVLLAATASDVPEATSPDAAAEALEGLMRPGESVDQAAARLSAQGPDEMSFDEARRLKEYWLMRLNELEYDKKSRCVVLVEDVVTYIGQQYASVRTRLRAIGPNFGPQLARIKNPEQASAFITEVIDQALEELSADSPGMRWDLEADASKSSSHT